MNNLHEQLQNIKNQYAKTHKTFDEQLKLFLSLSIRYICQVEKELRAEIKRDFFEIRLRENYEFR